MPTSAPSDVKSKEDPPNSSATPTSKSPPKPAASSAKETKPAEKGNMGARLSTSPGSAGKAPSTASASSTHTASTVPADSAEAKKSKTGGVAGFLRRKPSTKSEASAGPSSGDAGKKSAKKGVGNSLRTSLFKRSTKSKNGTDAPAPVVATAAPAGAASGSASPAAAAAGAGGQKPAAVTAAAAATKPPEKNRTSPEKARASPEKSRSSPEKSRASPGKSRASPEKSPGGRRGASPPKGQRPPSQTGGTSAETNQKALSPRADGAGAVSRSNQALTPDRKEALKKQWFTDGQPMPEPAGRGRASGKAGAGSRVEPRSKPAPGETVGPPATASRVSGSAFSTAAAKFGGVKAPAKPRPGSPKKGDKSPGSPKKADRSPGNPKKAGGAPGSPKKADKAPGSPKKGDISPRNPKKVDKAPDNPKKSGEADKTTTADGMGDLMDAMVGFKAGYSGKAKDGKEKEDATAEANAKLSDKDVAKASASSVVDAKPDVKDAAADGGLADLMGAMEGFSHDGSKKDESKTDGTNNGAGSPKGQVADTKEGKDKTKGELMSVKEDEKTVDEKSSAKDSTNVNTSDKKESAKDSKSNAEKDEKVEKNAEKKAEPQKDSKNISKSDAASAKSKDIVHEDKKSTKDQPSLPAKDTDSHQTSDGKTAADTKPSDAAEPKADKTTTWQHGDSDSGELGLGGISQEDREERAQRPSAPKDQMADLDFLMGQIDTTPKAPAKETKPPTKEDSPKIHKKKPGDKDEGLDDLMDLAKGFDMSAMSKSEPVAAKAPTVSDMAPSDMDKFLDFMDTAPAKPSAPPTGQPITEEKAVKKDTWRTGDGDDEAMAALMNKPRDNDAPAQPPDWDIDDLLVDKVPKKPESKTDDKQAADKKAPSGKANTGGFSGFDDFIGDSLSGDAVKKEDKSASGDDKAKMTSSKGEDKKTDKETGDKGFSGFDDFLAESLSEKDSAADGDSKKSAKASEKEGSDKKLDGNEFSAFDDFLSGSPSGKEAPAMSTGGSSHEEAVAVPKKASAVDSAPPARVEEEVVAAVASSQTSAAPGSKHKPASDKHISKEGNTRGSVPDHGHGARDVLYDDSDKTGTKPAATRAGPKSREPAVLDDLIRPAKASTTSSAPAAGVEEAVVAQAASTTEAGKRPGQKASDEHREKPGNTRGSVPDHGHGVRDQLYDDSDKTGRKKSVSKEDAKPRKPAPLDDLIQPKKVAASHATPGERHSPSSGEEDDEEEIAAETAHQSHASGQPAGKKGKKSKKKKHAKEGDTRGSVPDHGHGVRDLLYDDSDKTGQKAPPVAKGDTKPREPAALDDLIQPKKVAASHASPAARSPSPDSEEDEEEITAQTAHQAHAPAPPTGKKGKKANKKKKAKEGDTRGSVPDHGHGVRDVLYDDSDKTGRKKPESKDTKPREPAPLDDLIQPKKAAASHAAPGKSLSHSPSSDEGEEEEMSAETAHQSHASAAPAGKKGRKSRKKKQAKEGNTRGSVPDHGHGARDVLYDDSDKTGQKKPASKDNSKSREPEVLDDLIRPVHATHTASAPPAAAPAAAPEGPLEAKVASTAQSAPPSAASPSPQPEERPRKSLSLAGMTDPDQEDDDDGEELRRLIASTEALHAQLHSASRGDSKQEHAVQEQTSQELERLERSLEQRERRLETAGRGQEVKAAKEGLQKVKQQLDASRAAAGAH